MAMVCACLAAMSVNDDGVRVFSCYECKWRWCARV